MKSFDENKIDPDQARKEYLELVDQIGLKREELANISTQVASYQLGLSAKEEQLLDVYQKQEDDIKQQYQDLLSAQQKLAKKLEDANVATAEVTKKEEVLQTRKDALKAGFADLAVKVLSNDTKAAQNASKQVELEGLEKDLCVRFENVKSQEQSLVGLRDKLAQKETELKIANDNLDARNRDLDLKQKGIDIANARVAEADNQNSKNSEDLDRARRELTAAKEALMQSYADCSRKQDELDARVAQINATEVNLNAKEKFNNSKEAELLARAKDLETQANLLAANK